MKNNSTPAIYYKNKPFISDGDIPDTGCCVLFCLIDACRDAFQAEVMQNFFLLPGNFHGHIQSSGKPGIPKIKKGCPRKMVSDRNGCRQKETNKREGRKQNFGVGFHVKAITDGPKLM